MSGACSCQGRHRQGGRDHPHTLRHRGLPTTTPRPFSAFFFSFKLPTHQSFFHDKLYTLQARRDPQEGHTLLQATQAKGARGKKASCNLMLELPKRSGGSGHKGGSLRLARPRPLERQPHRILWCLTRWTKHGHKPPATGMRRAVPRSISSRYTRA